jgi:transposase
VRAGPGGPVVRRNQEAQVPHFHAGFEADAHLAEELPGTEVAMESTGQYWRSLWNLLEGEFEKLILVNPQHIKGLNGYKTDPKHAQWIAGLRTR